MTNTFDNVAQFEQNAIAYLAAAKTTDVAAVNRHSDELYRLFLDITGDAEQCQRFLLLLNSPEPSVRMMTSVFGLRLDEASCRRQLQEFAENGPYKFEAEQCLRRWNENEWSLDSIPQTKALINRELYVAPKNIDVLSFGRSLPRQMSLTDIVLPNELDMRIGQVDIWFANIIGVNSGYLSFCPNSEPPSDAEVLAWTWIVRPDFGSEIADLLEHHEFAEAIRQLC